MQKTQKKNSSWLGQVRSWISKKNQKQFIHYKMVLSNKQVVKGVEEFDGWIGYDGATNALRSRLHLQARNFFGSQIVYIEFSV